MKISILHFFLATQVFALQPFEVIEDTAERRAEILALDKKYRQEIDFQGLVRFLQNECQTREELSVDENGKTMKIDLTKGMPNVDWSLVSPLSLGYKSGDWYWYPNDSNKWGVTLWRSCYSIIWVIEARSRSEFRIIREEIVIEDYILDG